jgi:hypothetical protein
MAAKAVYNMYVSLGLDALMVILWLATMASLAALRATFKYPVEIETFNDKRDLGKRDEVVAIATNKYLAIMVAAAVIAAFQMYVIPQPIFFFDPFPEFDQTGFFSLLRFFCPGLVYSVIASLIPRPTRRKRKWNSDSNHRHKSHRRNRISQA